MGPKQLTEHHKLNRVANAREFLERFELEGENFLSSTVTSDETWAAYYTPETKDSHHSGGTLVLLLPKSSKPQFRLKKIMASVFWDRKGVILIDSLPQGKTITAAQYCGTLRKLKRAIQNQRRGMFTKEVCLLHDITCPHTANAIKARLNSFGWDILNHPSYFSYLAPSDFHLFT